MQKFKLFISNFLIYGIGGIINKIIPFFMVPIVTRMFPSTSYMGLNELFNTISNFANTIALFGMYDAMFRFFFEKDDFEYKKSICTTALFFVISNTMIVIFIMLFFRKWLAITFFGNIKYMYFVIIAALGTIINALSVMMAAPTRMENKRRVFLITNIISPLIAYTISITLLMNKMYEIALPIGSLISSIGITSVFIILNHKWFSVSSFDFAKIKVLLTIALPVVPISFIYWIFNSCDRLMVTNMISVEATGIYSVGAKFGTISQLIYTAFSGGWQYFVYSTMKENNQVETNSKIFEYLAAISFIATIAICSIIYFVFNLLFEPEYLDAYLVTPYLFLAPLLQMLFQVLGSQMTIHKKTWMNTLFLVIATLFNIGANYILIPKFGVEGAAISTLAGYTIAIVLSIYFAKKFNYFTLSKRFIISAFILVIYYIVWRGVYSENIVAGVIGLSVSILGYCFLYKNELTTFITVIQRKFG